MNAKILPMYRAVDLSDAPEPLREDDIALLRTELAGNSDDVEALRRDTRNPLSELLAGVVLVGVIIAVLCAVFGAVVILVRTIVGMFG